MKLKTGNPRVRGPRRNASSANRPARRAEPATFAWIEPLADVNPVVVEREILNERTVERIVEKVVEKPIVVEKEVFIERPASADATEQVSKKKKETQPKAIIVGRGPSLATKVGRVMPKPMPVLAGAASLLAVLVLMTLMSPSSDNANAERGKSTVARAGATTATPALTLDDAPGQLRGKSRDPFAAKEFKGAPATAATGAAAKTNAEQAKAAKAAAATRAGAPAAAASSLFVANLTTYSSYTPWKKARKRAGGWIDFDAKPTVKVLSVGKSSALLFVVTDVEVVKDKSAHISYNKPVRQVKLAKGGVVRFADYRNIQGDDVTYTIRYDGSEKIKLAAVPKN